jgi:hypothetical protein
VGRVEVGVVSDTHGLLRPAVLEALAGCDLVLHAGDVGAPSVLDGLARIAPVRAVRGNVDGSGALAHLPRTETVELAGHLVHVLHVLDELDLDPGRAGLAVVIYGHTHRPAQEVRDGVLYLNPGSAGPRRFDLPVSLARLTADARGVEARRVDLAI